MITFHLSGYRAFKANYLAHVCQHWRAEFPGLVSYSRFIEFAPLTAIPHMAYLHCLFGESTGISYIDSTSTVLAVCRNQRIHQHKVFKGLATRGKSSRVRWAGSSASSCIWRGYVSQSLFEQLLRDFDLQNSR